MVQSSDKKAVAYFLIFLICCITAGAWLFYYFKKENDAIIDASIKNSIMATELISGNKGALKLKLDNGMDIVVHATTDAISVGDSVLKPSGGTVYTIKRMRGKRTVYFSLDGNFIR